MELWSFAAVDIELLRIIPAILAIPAILVGLQIFAAPAIPIFLYV